MRIVTAIGDAKLNEELKKDNFYKVLGTDIQYQEGIFETLEKNKDANYLILNLNLDGELTYGELTEEILDKYKELKIIYVVEREDREIIDFLVAKKIRNIILKKDLDKDKINNIIKNKQEDFISKKKVMIIIKK